MWPDYDTRIAVYKLEFGGGLNAPQVRAVGDRLEVARLAQLPPQRVRVPAADQAVAAQPGDGNTEAMDTLPADLMGIVAEVEDELEREAAGDIPDDDPGLDLEAALTHALELADLDSALDEFDVDSADSEMDELHSDAAETTPAACVLSPEQLDDKAALWKTSALASVPALDALQTGRGRKLGHNKEISLVRASVPWSFMLPLLLYYSITLLLYYSISLFLYYSTISLPALQVFMHPLVCTTFVIFVHASTSSLDHLH